MKRVFFHILLFVLVSNWSFAQTTFVPDTNLRKVLMASYSDYMNASGYVVDAKAATFTGTFSCPASNIRDVTGLWKFTGIVTLNCQNNVLANLDSLRKFPNLSTLFCFNNRITKLPDMLTLSKLSYLSCYNNLLTSMPDLSTQTSLTYLDCSRNRITTIKGLDKLINLQSLFVYNNRLDSLPNLTNLTKLTTLQCQGNNLRRLQGLNKLTQLTALVAGSNQFDSLPDMSGLTKLVVLMFYNCQLSAMPNVSNMPNLSQLALGRNKLVNVPDFSGNAKLTILELDNNAITKLPDFSASKSTLKILKLNDNKLDSLPNFASYISLDTAHVHNNRLTFEDVISLAKRTSIDNVKYAPQDTVGTKQEIVLDEKLSFKIVLGIDKNVTGNQYTWYKNGQLHTKTTHDTLLISSVQASDSGFYTCQVMNAQAPKLTLKSHAVRLRVNPCIDLSKLAYTTTDFDCNIGGTVVLNETSMSGGVKPYLYKLLGNELGSTRFPDGNSFTNLFESSYSLEVKDQSGCKSLSNVILLKGRKGVDCKQLVILGNDYSPNNTLLLEERGTAKVYDNEGQLVQTFSTPVAWDGKNKNGDFLPGFYLIDLNGKILKVNLIK